MSIVKKLLISIIAGSIGYEISKFSLDGGLQIPATTPEISLLLIFIATALAATLLGGSSSSSTSASSSPSSSSTSSDDRELGTVKWFNVRKGYGFITRDQGEDIFVHFRNIEGKGRRAIAEGERVSFVVTNGDKGPQADEVSPA
jgi:CspA family cold shock protein